ncbi:MAG: DUF1698 domain-containing protein [Acidimicrobiia bacterium]
MPYPTAPKAMWPFQLPPDTAPDRLQQITEKLDSLAVQAQYGWGQTMDFGLFTKDGILGENYLDVAGLLDKWGWWPTDLTGRAVADVGCFSGGHSLYLSARNPTIVYAVDEIPEHLQQCAYLAELFEQKNIKTVESSVYFLSEHIAPKSLDLILLSGVLYHLSDMLVGLYGMRQLLKPGGTLLIETNAVDDFEQSYANFGRFFAGMWWQPSGLCVQDMCEFMGFEAIEVRFFTPTRCLVRATCSSKDIPFNRGLNWRFDSLRDAVTRTMDAGVMAPVQSGGNSTGVAGWAVRILGGLWRRFKRVVSSG